MFRFLKYMLQLVMSPSNGWEDVSHAGVDPEKLKAEGLFPILGIAACSAFCQLIYHPEIGVAVSLMRAIVIFSMYFLTLFLAIYAFPAVIHECVSTEINSTRVNTFIIYSLGLMSLITIIENLIPMELSIVQFLPIVVVLVMWKGVRYLDIATPHLMRFIIAAIVIILLPPILISLLFGMIIPTPTL